MSQYQYNDINEAVTIIAYSNHIILLSDHLLSFLIPAEHIAVAIIPQDLIYSYWLEVGP